jgi:glutamyl-tRNA synthetase
MAKGTPHTYRFRVPEGERIEIDDMIRGKVGWDTDTLGDFVLLRSNGMPVYNFCVAVDDATMGITHVLRAEEHLPNTLRQALAKIHEDPHTLDTRARLTSPSVTRTRTPRCRRS